MTDAVSTIDWTTWRPTDVATLLFVRDGGRLLLIRKKRGLGRGLINGPGGRVDPGESPREAALRELQEELAVTAFAPSWRGEHRFQFADGYSMHVHVYMSDRWRGEPTETDEAVPLWVALDAIPFDEMWADDRHWMPLMLAGNRFSGRFLFDGAAMLDMELTTLKADEPDRDDYRLPVADDHR